MSKTVDQRVVEMRFDNKHFEQNVSTTMSTLEKLKQKLNFTGATKGLEDISRQTKNISFDGMVNGINTVEVRFSYLQMSIQRQINKIVDNVTNAGLRIAKALTIEPVTTGFNEYELKMDSVKTIMASTGEDIQTVNKYLNELNTYSDQTIYSFSDMTQNIGKFTNAGVKLEDAVIAMKGLSNEAAVSGANANEASRAMYNFAQALSMGYVQLIDWKSIENANMATVEFKQQLLDTAVAVGTVTKEADDMYSTGGDVLNLQQMFKDGLQDQWLTTEVLINTLKDYGDETTEIGKKAYAAAQNVTTLTQMWSVLKETAQSGWARTWEIIFGDFNQAKALFSPLTTFFSNIIEKIDYVRNKILESALSKSIKSIGDNVKNIVAPIQKSADNVKNIVKTVQDYANVVDEIIGGKWGNGQTRWDALAAAGYDWAHAQNLVNEQLGFSLRHATDYKEVTDEVADSQEEVSDSTAELIENLTKYSDKQLKAKGYTDDQIKSLRELEKTSRKLGVPIRELIKYADEINGRWLLMRSFKNLGESLVTIFKSIGQAWKEAIYGTNNTEEIIKRKSEALFNLVVAFNKLSNTIKKFVNNNSENLMRTFRGLFSVVGIVADVLGGVLKILGAVLKEVFQLLGFGTEGVLSFTASLGDAIYYTRQWIKDNKIIDNVVNKIIPKIFETAKAIAKWADATFHIRENLDKLKTTLISVKDAITDWAKGAKNSKDVSKYIFEGLINGLTKYGTKAIQFIMNIGQKLLDGICKVLGIHSPSVEFYKIGGYIIQGLINGIKDGSAKIFTTIQEIAKKIVNIFKSIDFGKVVAVGLGAGILLTVKELIDLTNKVFNLGNKLTAPLVGLKELFEGIGSYWADKGTAQKIEAIGNTIKSMAVSVLIIAGAILLISKIPKEDLWRSVAVVGGIIVAVGALYALVNSITKSQGMKDAAKSMLSITSLVGLAFSLLIVAKAFKKLGSMEWDEIGRAVTAIIALVVAFAVLILALSTVIDPKAENKVQHVGTMIKKIATALLIMVVVTKLAAILRPDEIRRGITVIAAFELLILGLVGVSRLVSKDAQYIQRVGTMLKRISMSLLIMIAVIKLAAMLKGEEIAKGLFVIGSISVFFAALIAVSKLAGENASKAGTMMLSLSTSMLIMIGVIKLIASLSDDEIKRGLTVVTGIGLIFTALIAVSNLAGKNAIKAGIMILMISGALVMLTGVLFMLSKMDTAGLYKALGVVSVLEILFGGLIVVSKYAKNCQKTLITMLVVISLLIAMVIGLTFIDPAKLAIATGSVSAIIGMLTLLVHSTKALGDTKGLIKTLGTLVISVGILAGIIALMTMLDPTKVLASAGALSILLLSLSVSFGIISYIGPLAEGATGSLIAMGLVVAGLAVILGVLASLKLDSQLEIAASLSILLLSMAGALAILSLVGAAWEAALIGIGCLAAFIASMALILYGLGKLSDDTKKFISDGLPVLEQLGYAIGAFIGNIVGGFAAGVSNGFETIGENLTKFMNSIGGFIEGARGIDSSVVKGVGYLSLAIITISAAELYSAIATFLSGKFSLAQLGTELSQFMLNALPFLATAMTITPDMVKGVKYLGDAILSITKAELLQSITSWLGGGNSLETFGTQIASLGTGMKNFITNLGTFTPDQLTSVNCACQALKMLAEAAKTIPNSGGWAGKIFGENDIDIFAVQFPKLGKGLVGFVKSMEGFSADQLPLVECACKALKMFTSASETIDNQGGLLAFIVGDNRLDKFSTQLPKLGTGLNNFIKNLSSFGPEQIPLVKCACKALKMFTSASETIDNQGGFLAFIVGDNRLDKFAEQLPKLGTGLNNFIKNLGTFSEDKITTVDCACRAIRAIAKLGEINIRSTGEGLATFGKNMVKFAKKVKEFVDNIGNSSADSISSAISKVKELISMAKTVASSNIESLKTFGTSLKKLAKDGVNGFVKELSAALPKAQAKTAGENLVKSFKDAITNKKDTVEKAAVKLANSADKGLTAVDLKSKGETAGKNLGEGLVIGIDKKQTDAYNAGFRLGQKAVQGEKDGQKSHSPSKATIQAGKWIGEGLVIGINKMGNAVYGAGYNMGEKATNSISGALDTALRLIDTDMDMNPTIRPVLDLSDVESGAGYLNTMFNNPSIGVMSNLSAISNGMNSRIQNATNDDVVSAINKLSKNLGNVSGDTYNINGVTYDDGSNITDAVSTLIRAANIERRV